MKLKHCVVAVLVLVSACLSAKDVHWNFAKLTKPILKPSVRNYKPELGFTGEGADRVLRLKTAKPVSLYTFFVITPDSGEMRLSVRYKASQDMKIAINFNLKGQGNGSAGRTSMELPASEKFSTYENTVNIPKGTWNFQLIFATPRTDTAFVLDLSALDIVYIADKVKVPEFTPAAGTAPSAWKKAAVLRGFHDSNSGDPAKTQSEIRLAYDREKVYIGFIAFEPDMDSLKADCKERDKSVWMDDCLELFLIDSGSMKFYQFGVNPAGTVFDNEYRQAVPGDPWKGNMSWNSDLWSCKVFKNKGQWEARFEFPWALFNRKEPADLKMNFARERKADKELSCWNVYTGKFTELERYSYFSPAKGIIERTRATEAPLLTPDRKKTVFKEVLIPGKFPIRRTGFWSAGWFSSEYSPAVRKKYTKEQFGEWQELYYKAVAASGGSGPNFPWASMSLNGGMKLIEKYGAPENGGVQSMWFMGNSSNHSRAKRMNPDIIWYSIGEKAFRTDPAGKVYADSFIAGMENVAKNPKSMHLMKYTWFILGPDEPGNNVNRMYSRTLAPYLKKYQDAADADIRKTTGYGKYGLPDLFGKTPAEPLERIAFWKWWNLRLAANLVRMKEKAHELFPGVPFYSYNSNTTAGAAADCTEILSVGTDIAGCDPYPTAAASLFGFSRGMYHTGFSTKLTSDLRKSPYCAVMPQGFIYHGRRPETKDLREWASQSLKNGADILCWFVSGPAVLTMNQGFNDVLNLNLCISKLPLVKRPEHGTEPAAILYSIYDRWGLDDHIAYSPYTTYVIMGEWLKNSFRFAGVINLEEREDELKNVKILVVPRARYMPEKAAKKLVAFAKDGGHLLILDPDFMSVQPDGTKVPSRAELLNGAVLAERKELSPALFAGKLKLPVTVSRQKLDPVPAGYDFEKLPEGSKVLASYSDRKPAIVSWPVGKGKVILAGVQPFGDSSAAVNPEGWTNFFETALKDAGARKTEILWDFLLPAPDNKIQLKPMIH